MISPLFMIILLQNLRYERAERMAAKLVKKKIVGVLEAVKLAAGET